jgi:hypothetical protein
MTKTPQDRMNRLAFAVFTLMLLLLGGTVARAQRPESNAGNTAAGTETIPSFYLIRGWEATVAQTEHAVSTQPVEYAVERLCRYYGGAYNPTAAIRTSLAPLAWPRVFKRDTPNAHRQRIEIRALLEANSLVFREISPLDLRPKAFADSVAMAVSHDQPVLLNSPDAALVYGYDRREPDHWWWFDRAGAPEIVLESERTARYTYWTDDQAGGIAWAVTGVDSAAPLASDSLAWQFLRTIIRSIQGVPEDGVEAYPLSLRDFRDILASTDTLPTLSDPDATHDPLGILRAKIAREHLLLLLEELGAQQRDSVIIESLRLTEYHIHSAINMLTEMSTSLYGAITQPSVMDTLTVNWAGIRPRRRALEAMTDLLKAEKLATESLQIAVARHEELAVKPAPKPRRRGR